MDRLNSQSGERDKGEPPSSMYGFRTCPATVLKDDGTDAVSPSLCFLLLRLQPVHSLDGRFGERWQGPLSDLPSVLLSSSAAPQTVSSVSSDYTIHGSSVYFLTWLYIAESLWDSLTE